MSTSETHILKFGGSSLKTPELINQSAQIVIERMSTARPIVVVSAVGGVTDALINLVDQSQVDQSAAINKVQQLEERHQQLFDELISADHPKRNNLQELFGELESVVKNDGFREQTPRAWRDHILSVGERASALIFATLLSKQEVPAESYEANHFIKTDSTFGQANVDGDQTRKLVREFIKNSKSLPVITGFIGSDAQQQITTLGRSGSDYSASLIADALDADHLEIWTDVNGVLTADPRWVSTAEPIAKLSFADITEISAHGAKVIHPQTIQPIRDKQTSVLVKNSHNPTHPGTLITSGYHSNGALKTITVTGPFVRLQIEEKHAYELLSKLKEWLGDNPDSEAIGFKRTSDFEPARFLLRQSFFERINKRLARWAADRGIVLDLKADLYKVKKFSNHFERGSLTAQIWSLLSAHQLQPVSAERNLDERFISFLFKEEDAQLAARLMNDHLHHGDNTIVNLFIAGTGAVGQTLLEQLKSLKQEDFRFRLLGVCNSRNTRWNENGIDINSGIDWSGAQSTNWEKITDKLTQPYRHNLIFVDATGSEEVARLYPELIKNGIHIVTPSKLANTFEQSFFDHLQMLVEKHHTSFRYETTVGAGLPVISTIQDLKTVGDTITEISGVVSGTMTYLFNQLEQGIPFSDAIVKARELGYAEPDPREDLSGEDVARKFLTLARTLGLSIERNELQVESLIPEELNNADRTEYLNRLHEYDSEWQQRILTAQKRGETLRYTGRLKEGKISIGIQSVPKDSPLGQLKGTDNLIQITSQFYNQTPLVIQGPGAGKEVTAAGVLNDILQTAKSLS